MPAICWGPDMHKNRARITLPLHPSLAAMLLAHREQVPHGDDDQVFPVRPTRAGLRADVDRCGFSDAFSAHSLRKWGRTSLVEAGVQADLVDILMRHQTLAGRYTMPSQTVLLQALTALPTILPLTVDARFLGDGVQKDLTEGGVVADTERATRSPSGTRKINSRTAPAPNAGTCVSLPDHASGALGPSFTAGASPKRAKESNAPCDPRMPICGAQVGVDSIADWLEATARLIRSLGHEPATIGIGA